MMMDKRVLGGIILALLVFSLSRQLLLLTGEAPSLLEPPPEQAREQQHAVQDKIQYLQSLLLSDRGQQQHPGSVPTSREQTPAPPRKIKIALLVPVISTNEDDYLQLPLFTHFLPTLLPTLEPDKFSYKIFLGADVGDRIFDDEQALPALLEHFQSIVQRSESRDAIALQVSHFEGNKGAPCWVWNALAQTAYNQSFDYFYQVNDDLQFVTRGWSTAFVRALRERGDVGVVGPNDLHNSRILTQSFVPRSHYEIFNGEHFPREFRNWYSDDWISAVYPSENTHKLYEIEVRNGVAGQRYVHDSVGHLVATHVASGREKVAKYKARHPSTPYSLLMSFL